MKYQELTEKIIGCFYTVYNTLGYGFLESVYEKAMLIELHKQGLKAVAQYPIKVYYDGQVVGEFSADILVEDCVVLELKAIKVLIIANEAQLLNELNSTEFEVGLVLNFGVKPEVRRKTFDNALKKYRPPSRQP
jgi:GxxExxY protein